MAQIIHLVNERDNALRLILRGRGYAKVMRQGARMGLNYFQSLDYAEQILSLGCLCLDNRGEANIFANDNVKIIKKRKSKRSEPLPYSGS